LADFLRREGGLPALAESDLHVCTDNPLGAAVLALVHAAAHPGDSLAWEHLRMTPLGDIMAESGIGTPAALAETVLIHIHSQGFERTVEGWLRQLEPRLAADDAFSRLRARQFAEAARIFDETGSRDTAEFVAFMERHTVRDAESASVIRVMTIHKSKGLGFDVVLLPDLEGRKLDQRRKGLAMQKNPDRSIEWVLDLPNELFRESDPVLSAHVAEAEAEAGYEALSLLYVAMTRAKRAMYAIIEPVGDSKSLNYPKVLSDTLGSDATVIRVGGLRLPGVWAAGDQEWHVWQTPVEADKAMRVGISVVDSTRAQRAARHPARRPSDGKRGAISAAPLFALPRGGAADFGAEVHRLLAEIEWIEPRELVRQEAKWRAGNVATDAMEAALGCLRAAEMAALWKRPEGGKRREIWRERAFEVVLEGVWFTGVFDRVLVEHDASGRAVSAWVIDFKTDRAAGAGEAALLVEKHAGQLNLYRRVAARLSGLPVQAVRCTLALVAGPSLAEVPTLV
jgi:ATP-dependent exoDNAse (exonuclease V) beta subunit